MQLALAASSQPCSSVWTEEMLLASSPGKAFLGGEPRDEPRPSLLVPEPLLGDSSGHRAEAGESLLAGQ